MPLRISSRLKCAALGLPAATLVFEFPPEREWVSSGRPPAKLLLTAWPLQEYFGQRYRRVPSGFQHTLVQPDALAQAAQRLVLLAVFEHRALRGQDHLGLRLKSFQLPRGVGAASRRELGWVARLRLSRYGLGHA